MNQYSPADLARATVPGGPQDVEEAVARVGALVTDLDALTKLPTIEHVAVFEEVQQVLADTLSAVDEA
jgi:hypothetical protein